MTTDLTMLLWTTMLCWALPFLYIAGLPLVENGFTWGLGNREQPLMQEAAWAARARRAHANTVENLLPFAALVLIAHVTNHANATTALGAQVFFWSRVAYTVVYVMGLVPWRTLVFAIGQTGLLMIASALF